MKQPADIEKPSAVIDNHDIEGTENEAAIIERAIREYWETHADRERDETIEANRAWSRIAHQVVGAETDL